MVSLERTTLTHDIRTDSCNDIDVNFLLLLLLLLKMPYPPVRHLNTLRRCPQMKRRNFQAQFQPLKRTHIAALDLHTTLSFLLDRS